MLSSGPTTDVQKGKYIIQIETDHDFAHCNASDQHCNMSYMEKMSIFIAQSTLH